MHFKRRMSNSLQKREAVLLIYMVAILFVLLSLYLFIRFQLLKREMRRITKQLHQYNHDRTENKITISLVDQELEVLATEINALIDRLVLMCTEKNHSENE